MPHSCFLRIFVSVQNADRSTLGFSHSFSAGASAAATAQAVAEARHFAAITTMQKGHSTAILCQLLDVDPSEPFMCLLLAGNCKCHCKGN